MCCTLYSFRGCLATPPDSRYALKRIDELNSISRMSCTKVKKFPWFTTQLFITPLLASSELVVRIPVLATEIA